MAKETAKISEALRRLGRQTIYAPLAHKPSNPPAKNISSVPENLQLDHLKIIKNDGRFLCGPCFWRGCFWCLVWPLLLAWL